MKWKATTALVFQFLTLVCPIGIFAAFGWNAKVPIPPSERHDKMPKRLVKEKSAYAVSNDLAKQLSELEKGSNQDNIELEPLQRLGCL